MSKNGVTTDGGVDDSNIISGSGNTIIQIINKVYKKDDLNKMVGSSFRDPAELRVFWGETFPAVDPGLGWHEEDLQAQSPYEALINDFKRGNEMVRLFGEIKKRSPTEYRNFLAGQALDAIGLTAKNIQFEKSYTKVVEKEISKLQKIAISQHKVMDDDTLEFEDRTELFDEIRDKSRSSSHVVLHGPSGVGKTHFLMNFPKIVRDRYNGDTACVFIDLNGCKPESILAMAIEQLGGEEKPNSGFLELATVISTLLNGRPRINRFYFLFDNADQNQAAIDYLFGRDNLIDNSKLKRLLKGWGLLGKIELKIVIAARQPVKPSTIHPPFSGALQEKMTPLSRHSVQNMLEDLIIKKNIPVHLNVIMELSDEVYYLTGGHPKCAKQMLVALAELGCVKPTKDKWEQLYREHVISTIHAEMLSSIDLEVLSIIWNLSIFRRFDSRLLEGLLDRGILPSLPGDKSRQARDLRMGLEEINLFDIDGSTSTTITNYAMRQALSLNMYYDAPDRYKMLHVIALEMFLDRLHSEAGLEKQVERTTSNLLEILYHWTKLLEIELRGRKPQPKSGLLYAKICNAFENYLLFALTMIQNKDHSAFFQILGAKWKDDTELQETVRRVTRREDCVHALKKMLNKYYKIQDGVD